MPLRHKKPKPPWNDYRLASPETVRKVCTEGEVGVVPDDSYHGITEYEVTQMLTDEEIKESIHASRVVSLPPANFHGPLGLMHLAAYVHAIVADMAKRFACSGCFEEPEDRR